MNKGSGDSNRTAFDHKKGKKLPHEDGFILGNTISIPCMYLVFMCSDLRPIKHYKGYSISKHHISRTISARPFPIFLKILKHKL